MPLKGIGTKSKRKKNTCSNNDSLTKERLWAGFRSRLWKYAEEAAFADYPFFLPHAPFWRILSFEVQIANPNPFLEVLLLVFKLFCLGFVNFSKKSNVCFKRKDLFKVLMKWWKVEVGMQNRLIWWAPFCTNKCKSFSKTNVNFPRTIVSELRNVFKILQ